MNYDIFNGDADGIIALLQLRLADPIDSQLITGVKRDIKLVEKVDVQAGDELTVLDISMEKNMAGLEQALAQGAHVFYADHHKAGDIPQHGNLDAHIDLDANMCTALIVDKLLEGRFHTWAITAAYGDNLIAKADALADQAGLNNEQKAQLKELGTLINYNGYGSKVDDLHFHPADLYRALVQYISPFEVIEDKASPYYQLQLAYQQDMDAAQAVPATYESDTLKLFELPNTAASRRISGVYGNWLANQNPDSAHAVLTENADGTYTVSLRAPLNNKQGAVAVCGQFPTGGGREAAAGINALRKEDVNAFIDEVETYYA
ncbi:TPA: DHH family phosphoesterase [Vibrio parahaemolyticus]|uniref:DHH family phosphoesterase n=1 Tax=Vibrio parahaemolyticus TaxID=670 RepID=UPI00146B7BDF|nr:DHH family phosphoesterase [Vibrio parahaemolyticus]EKB1966491.1 DHH family phosphoesterase [Vibrio parahaemolyticus]ELA8092794.1 DHH family phosphoesterase [Vibrio parahaemolyticus]MBE4111595.1 DHH family phosphoesterase [Vibrio parahaemolyticus]MBE4407904.1 DHH family phosphoesterase [Vibrio parahaemolyticus]MBM4800025.1 DHH family phosphoesterase [Vibrio parahaemolyticus]